MKTDFQKYKQEILDLGISEGVMQVEKGWYPLLAGLFRELRNLNPETWNGKYVAQVEQKFAGLRVNFDRDLSPEENKLIDFACYESENTCEFCGQPGRKSCPNGFWLQVVCESCYDSQKKVNIFPALL